MFVVQLSRKVEAFSLDLIFLRVRSDALSLFLSFGLSLCLKLFGTHCSFFRSFSLLTDLSQLTEGNDNQPESFFLPLENGFKIYYFFLETNTSSKKKFHHSETSSGVSRAIAKRSSWVVRGAREGAKRQWYMLQLILAFSLPFFPSWYWTPWCSTLVTILPFEIKMASFSKVKAAIMQAQRWTIFLHRGVCSFLGCVIANSKRVSWAEREERSDQVQRGARTPEQRWAGQLVRRPYFSRPKKYRRSFFEPTYWPRRSWRQYGEGSNQADIFEAEGNKSLIPAESAHSPLSLHSKSAKRKLCHCATLQLWHVQLQDHIPINNWMQNWWTTYNSWLAFWRFKGFYWPKARRKRCTKSLIRYFGVLHHQQGRD